MPLMHLTIATIAGDSTQSRISDDLGHTSLLLPQLSSCGVASAPVEECYAMRGSGIVCIPQHFVIVAERASPFVFSFIFTMYAHDTYLPNLTMFHYMYIPRRAACSFRLMPDTHLFTLPGTHKARWY